MTALKNLRPCFFGLCFVHIWIYCTTHRPSVGDEVSTMAVMYLLQSVALVALLLVSHALMKRGKVVSSLPKAVLAAADVAGAAFMSLCALALAGVLPGGIAVAAVASGLGGIGVTWAYARWCEFYAKLDLRLAAPLVFATMVVGSACKAAVDLMSAWPAAIVLAVVPWLTFGCARLSLADVPAPAVEPKRYYNWRTVASLGRLAAGVAAFSLTIGIVQSLLLEGLPEPYHASVLLHHGCEVLIAAIMVVWLAPLGRGLNFSRTWRIILVLMATALIFEPYLDATASSYILSLVRTAQTFLIVFLFLAISDVARHGSYDSAAVFGAGWIAYSLPFTVGKVIGDSMVSSGHSHVLVVSVVVWALVMVTLFVMDSSSDGNHLVFAEINDDGEEDTPATRTAALHAELDALAAAPGAEALAGQPAGGQQASTDGAPAGQAQAGGNPAPTDYTALRCEKLAEQYGLTRREFEILGLLVRGRSKAHIAEAFIISENTVRGHVKHIYAKLEIHNKHELLDLFEATK